MRVWMDMANSPHPVLLAPVADELERAGHEVWVTARDHAQTADLTRRRWPDFVLVGGPSPTSRVGKLRVLGARIAGLRHEAVRQAPDVALSLNSYAQMVAARAAGIPSVTLMDYEYQPANHLGFRLAMRVVVPSAFPQGRLRRYGVRSEARLCRFDGYKEEFYLDQLSGDAEDSWAEITPDHPSVRLLFRPPPTGAMYHREGNVGFDELLARFAARADTCVLVLARFPDQRARYGAMPGVHVADRTVDGIKALLSADGFFGAGGTMCREAALLGVPAYTLFAGSLAAVDAKLIAEGKLHDLRSPGEEIDLQVPRRSAGPDWERIRQRADSLRRWLSSVVEETAAAAPDGRRTRQLYLA
jgi:predicted glycosyltransferase